MSIKYRITEAQLVKIHERLNESVEAESMMDEGVPENNEDPNKQPGSISEDEMEEGKIINKVVNTAKKFANTDATENPKQKPAFPKVNKFAMSEKENGSTATPKKAYAPEAHKSQFMAKPMREDVGKEKFTGTKVAGTKTPGEWDKNVKTGKTPTDGIKSGGAAKNIEGTKAKTGEWEEVTKTSPEAKAHIVKGMKAGDVKNSMGAKAAPTKDTADKTKTQAPEAKKHVENSLKSGGAAKDIESAKAKSGNWEDAKTGSVNEKKSMSSKEMRDEKKRAMEERANKMDGLA